MQIPPATMLGGSNLPALDSSLQIERKNNSNNRSNYSNVVPIRHVQSHQRAIQSYLQHSVAKSYNSVAGVDIYV